MSIQEKLKNAGKSIGEFCKNNSNEMNKAVRTVGVAWLCKELGIPITPSYGQYSNRYYNPGATSAVSGLVNSYILAPDNPIEASILAITETALKCSFDSERMRSADNIVDILKANKDEIDDDTKTYAIDMLRRIAGVMTFDSGIQYINRRIANIAKGVY